MRGIAAVACCSNGPQVPPMATVVPGGRLSIPMFTVLDVDDPSDAAMTSLKSSPWTAATAVT